MNLFIVKNPYEFFNFFVRSWKYRFEKKWDYNRATASSIIQKILVRAIWNLVTKTY